MSCRTGGLHPLEGETHLLVVVNLRRWKLSWTGKWWRRRWVTESHQGHGDSCWLYETANEPFSPALVLQPAGRGSAHLAEQEEVTMSIWEKSSWKSRGGGLSRRSGWMLSEPFWSLTVTAEPVSWSYWYKRRLLIAAAAQGRSRLHRWCFKAPLTAVTLCFHFSGKVTDCHLMQTGTDKMGALGLYQPLIQLPEKCRQQILVWHKWLHCNAGSDTSYPSSDSGLPGALAPLTHLSGPI